LEVLVAKTFNKKSRIDYQNSKIYVTWQSFASAIGETVGTCRSLITSMWQFWRQLEWT